jgi:alpha-galactosidase
MRFILCVLVLACTVAAVADDAVPSGIAPASAPAPAFWSWAQRPVMGWNSWDCFGAGVNEEQTLANAQYMKENLLSHGYSLITVDIQWYEPLAHTTQYRRGAVLEMDNSGRLLPAPNRFPLTKETRSFKPLADKLHAMGLKFGLHLMRGIPRQAVDQNVLILGTEMLKDGGIHAADIASKTDICRWNTDMYGVDMTQPGAQEYYDSVLALMASWEIDFIKVDDLSAPRYHAAEVEAIRKAIDKTGRAIVLSTSPGATPVGQGSHVEMHANQWRISDDFWDNWRGLYSQFKRLDDWTPFRGPGHFPDADMLPVGNVRAWQERDSWTHFSHDELVTLMTLWSIARSPLIIGANLPKNDDFTLSILANDEILAVDQNSTNNHQLFNHDGQIAWLADVPNSKSKYLALFNAVPPASGRGASSPQRPDPAAADPASTPTVTISVPLEDLGISGPCQVRDLWTHKDLEPVNEAVSAAVNSHGAVLYRLGPKN